MDKLSTLADSLGLADYSDGPNAICNCFFGCDASLITENVVLAPNWQPAIFANSGAVVREIVANRVYGVSKDNKEFTFIRTGIGAPETGDRVLALGFTACKRAVIVGSCGSVSKDLNIGDFLVVDSAVSGEGFSRYLDDQIVPEDNFYRQYQPDKELTSKLYESAKKVCDAKNIPLAIGRAFTTDSVMGQFKKVDHIKNQLDCLAIEMEASAAMAAAKVADIELGVLVQASDVITDGKSLINERPKDAVARRNAIKNNQVAEIIFNFWTSI